MSACQEAGSTHLERLKKQREELLIEIEAQRLPEIEQMTYGSQAEAASDVFEQQRALSLRRHLETRLREVEDAIQRAQKGSHGLCEACGRPISPERLEIIPEARFCVECQRKREQRR